MWKRVVIEEHRNENPVKPAEFRHPFAAYSRRRPSPELLVTIPVTIRKGRPSATVLSCPLRIQKLGSPQWTLFATCSSIRQPDVVTLIHLLRANPFPI